ncbi:hypothetical protein EDD85DRAFT_871840 [Armillaria nabsnona]|nr:hypothetical protein EDD85DRAFT_871840 [Armillaria nabsnona]
MRNPQFRPLLEFYHEDAGKHLSETRQAARWLTEAPDDQLTPMLRVRDGEDYYIHELMILRDGVVCMPYRWRNIKHFSPCWRMETWVNKTNAVWRVHFKKGISRFGAVQRFQGLVIDHCPNIMNDIWCTN